jgi:hypothetical protein
MFMMWSAASSLGGAGGMFVTDMQLLLSLLLLLLPLRQLLLGLCDCQCSLRQKQQGYTSATHPLDSLPSSLLSPSPLPQELSSSPCL